MGHTFDNDFKKAWDQVGKEAQARLDALTDEEIDKVVRYDGRNDWIEHENGVIELEPDHPTATVCGHCGRGWDDTVVTGITPAPSGRCPFEYDHLPPVAEQPEPCSCGVHHIAPAGAVNRNATCIDATAATHDFDLVGAIIAHESGELDYDGTLLLFAHLIRTGTAWSLQGSYGRAAAQLIEVGLISAEGIIDQDAADDYAEEATR